MQYLLIYIYIVYKNFIGSACVPVVERDFLGAIAGHLGEREKPNARFDERGQAKALR